MNPLITIFPILSQAISRKFNHVRSQVILSFLILVGDTMTIEEEVNLILFLDEKTAFSTNISNAKGLIIARIREEMSRTVEDCKEQDN